MKKIIKLLLLLLISNSLFAQETYIPYRKGKLWGYADTTGKITIKPEYTSVNFYYNAQNTFIVEKDSKYGIVNTKGKKLSKIKYESLRRTDQKIGYITYLDKKYGYISEKGKEIVKNEYKYYWQNKSIIRFENDSLIRSFDVTQQKFIETRRETDDDEIYMDIEMDENYTSYPKTYHKKGYTIFNEGEKHRLSYFDILEITTAPNQIESKKTIDTIPGLFTKIIVSDKYSVHYAFVKNEEKWGLVSKNKLVTPIEFDNFSDTIINNKCSEFYFACAKNGKWGIINQAGETVLNFEYEKLLQPVTVKERSTMCFDINSGIPFVKNGKQGIVNLENKIILENIYTKIKYEDRRGWYEYYSETKKGIYSAKFQTPLVFEPNDILDYNTVNKTIYIQVKNELKQLKGYSSISGILFYKDEQK